MFLVSLLRRRSLGSSRNIPPPRTFVGEEYCVTTNPKSVCVGGQFLVSYQHVRGGGILRDDEPKERQRKEASFLSATSSCISVVSSSWPFAPRSFQILSRDTLDVLMPSLLSNSSRRSHATLSMRDSGASGCKGDCTLPDAFLYELQHASLKFRNNHRNTSAKIVK